MEPRRIGELIDSGQKMTESKIRQLIAGAIGDDSGTNPVTIENVVAAYLNNPHLQTQCDAKLRDLAGRRKDGRTNKPGCYWIRSMQAFFRQHGVQITGFHRGQSAGRRQVLSRSCPAAQAAAAGSGEELRRWRRTS